MGSCTICGTETDGSAVIYQADPAGTTITRSQTDVLYISSQTTTTTKRYSNVRQFTVYCCKKCRNEGRILALLLFVGTLISAGLVWLCVLGGPWYENLPSTPFYQLIKIACVLGVIVFGFLGIAGLFYSFVFLIYPYATVEQAALAHLNNPKNNNGHVYFTKKEGDTLRPMP